MKYVHFSITALVVFSAFCLYLIGVTESDDTYALLGCSFLPIIGIMFLTENDG